MAVARQYQTDVSTTAEVIAGTQYPGFILLNNGAETLFIGDENVTAADGFPIAAGDSYSPPEFSQRSLTGRPRDSLYGIVVTGPVDVRVLLQSRANV